MRMVAFLLLLVASTVSAEGGKLYKYTRDDGRVVLDFSIPPEYVHRGYTVLSPSGTVLEIVKPSMSPEEREALKSSEPERAEALDQQERQEENDWRLLALYATPDDAQRARDRKLDAIDLHISVDRGNVSRLKADLSNAQLAAANRERAGLVVSQDMIVNIESLLRQIASLQNAVDKRLRERDAIVRTYQVDIDRMQFLANNPELVIQLKAREQKRRGG